MSPEQAAGSTDLDAKTDVYSLAAVFYEMVIGEPVGTWVTDDCVELLHFVDTLPGHRARLDDMSAAVEQALVRALALRTVHRFSTPSEFADALEARGDRKYRHTEAKEILKRAASDEAAAPPAETGALSLAGVERIGAEVGIPARQVRQAAGVATRPDFQPKPSKFLGAPTVISFERVVEVELPEEDFPLLIEEIRVTLKNVGSINAYGKSLTWQTQRGPNQGNRDVHVMVTVRGGQTRIRVEEKIGALAGGLFGGIMGGAGGGVGVPLFVNLFIFAAPPVAFAALAAWLGGVYGLSRTIFTGVAGRRGYELRGLADRLAELVKDVSS
jgi:hypothetical protein